MFRCRHCCLVLCSWAVLFNDYILLLYIHNYSSYLSLSLVAWAVVLGSTRRRFRGAEGGLGDDAAPPAKGEQKQLPWGSCHCLAALVVVKKQEKKKQTGKAENRKAEKQRVRKAKEKQRKEREKQTKYIKKQEDSNSRKRKQRRR